MIRLAGIVVVLLAVIGCSEPSVMIKAGAGPQEFERDQYDCEVQVKSGPFAMAYARDPLGNMGYPLIFQRDMKRCLKIHGWVEEQKKP